MYHRIQKRLDELNLAIGEFPEVVADGIRSLVLQGREQEDDSAHQLQEIRNSTQTRALNELWSCRDSGKTTSGIVREKLMDVCSNAFAAGEGDAATGVRLFVLDDGRTVLLTAAEGMEESISLSSEPWKGFDLELEDLGFVRDPMGNPATFIRKDDASSWFSHEAIVDLLDGRPMRANAITGSYPTMLADPAGLSLDYAVDVRVPPRPVFWPPTCVKE